MYVFKNHVEISVISHFVRKAKQAISLLTNIPDKILLRF